MQKEKICWVVASPLTIRFFLMGHIVMLAKEYDLTVITYIDDPGFLANLGVPIRVIPVTIERNVSLWHDLRALIKLAFIFKRERFGLVHSLSPKSGLLAMVAAWLVRVPIRIHTFQGEVWVTRKGLWRAFLKFLDKLMAMCASHLLVVSLSEKQFLIDQNVVPDGRLQMLANGSICGVDVNRFKPDPVARRDVRTVHGISDEELVILYVGRLTADKGLMDLAGAFTRIAIRHPDAHLLVVGPDEEGMRAKMGRLCGDASLRLHFADYTNAPERYMAASDLLCLPSYREGFGLVLIEAAATGIPTIGSRIYGISDAVVDTETGLLFTVGDVNELTEKIELLIEDPLLRRALGANGKARACRDFSRGLVLAEFLKYYESVLPN